MAAGFMLVDMLTPGKLRELIWIHRNSNASLLLAANQLGIAVIVFTAIIHEATPTSARVWPRPSSSDCSASS